MARLGAALQGQSANFFFERLQAASPSTKYNKGGLIMNQELVKRINMLTAIAGLVAMLASALSIYTKYEIPGLAEFGVGVMVCGLTWLLVLRFRAKVVDKRYFLSMLTVHVFVMLVCFARAGARIYLALR